MYTNDILFNYYDQQLLVPAGSVKSRRDCQHAACRDLGVTPKHFTKGTEALVKDGRINSLSIKVGSQVPTQVLYIGELDEESFENTKLVLQSRAHVLRPYEMGRAAECFARALLKRLAHFGALNISGMTQKKLLGYEQFEKNRKDLRFRYTDRTGESYPVIVEVKNTTESYYPTKTKLFAGLLALAHKTKAQPALMVSYLSEEAMQFCQSLGIAVHVFERQFLSSELRAKAKPLFRHWNEEFQFISIDRPFANHAKYPDARTQRDLDVLSDPSWIEDPHRQWKKLEPSHEEIIRALEDGNLDAVDDILEAHDG